MKTKFCSQALGLFAAAAIVFTACNKDESTIDSATNGTTDSEIAVAASDSSGNAKDSVYFRHECGGGSQRDSIDQSALPATALAYLEENYPEYTFEKAFSVSDSAGTVTGYVVIIYSDDVPVGLEFDSEGDFVGVLEKRGHRGGHRGR